MTLRQAQGRPSRQAQGKPAQQARGSSAQRPAAQALGDPLPDVLQPGLDLVFVGINPGLASAAKGHHYAGPGNHFWPLLREAGFVPETFGYEDDTRVLEHNIGLTNLVERPSRGLADLSQKELQAGAARLREKLRELRPRVVCFNGKAIYEAFIDGRCAFGLQEEPAESAVAFVMPSTSARTAAYQRDDKLRFFQELKRIVDREIAT
ncbi:MAG: mismatch-specific DNA-glycosylase [Chloroflexi bacterium]|nr:mismatch-specific DNA-glycosylase [Chloroflexota bacterium]